MAYLCFPHSYEGDDDDDQVAIIWFQEPSRYLYSKVIPISFTVLHEWTSKDEALYK